MHTNVMIVISNIGSSFSKKMRKRSSELVFMICFSFLMGFPQETHASKLEKVMDTYLSDDFQNTVELLEQAVNESSEGYKASKKSVTSERSNRIDDSIYIRLETQ